MLFATLTSSCADGDLNGANGGGSMWGDLAGESVPSFGSAAFGLLTLERQRTDLGGQVTSSAETALVGHLLPGDSCGDGAELSRTRTEDEAAEVLSRVVPDGSWFGAVTLIVADLGDFGASGFDPPRHEVDLVGSRTVTLMISLCKQSAAPECFTAERGGIRVDVAPDDPQTLRISSRTAGMHDADGEQVWPRVGMYFSFDFSFARCEAIDEAVAVP